MMRTTSIALCLTLLLYVPRASCGPDVNVNNGRPVCLITDHGAMGDGKTLNTAHIQDAVETVHTQGGGKVVVPRGVFLTGSLVLKTGVELHIEKGATLLGSANPFDYTGTAGHVGLITADSATGVSVTGEGTVDGQGLQLSLTIDSLVALGQFEDPKYNVDRKRPSEGVRPRLIDFRHCTSVNVKGVTLRDAAAWVQVFTMCSNVVIDSVTVQSTAFWNNDGLDVCDCSNVKITNCDINSADDGICFKSVEPAVGCDSIAVSYCRVRSSASAVKFGTDSHGGFRDISIDHITVYDTYRSAIAIECVDGGRTENIRVSDVLAKNTGNAIFIRLGHRNPDAVVGSLKNVSVTNLKAEIPFGRPDSDYDLRGPDLPFFHNTFPASITGIPGCAVNNVVLTDIEISYPGRGTKGMAYIPLSNLGKVPEMERSYPEFSMFGELPAWAFYLRHVNGVTMQNVKLQARDSDYRPALVFDEVADVSITALNISTPSPHQEVVLHNVHSGEIGSVAVNGNVGHRALKLGSCGPITER
jgi:hypothetical protein